MSNLVPNNHSISSNSAPGFQTANRGQMDINMMYQRLMELGELLKDNREKTHDVVASANAFANRSANQDPELRSRKELDRSSTESRIAELTHENSQLRNVKDVLLREQRENSRLLGEYENAVSDILDKVRNVSFEKESENARITNNYNVLLQEEKDAHLKTRLERDEWHSRFLQSTEMLRKAYELRCREEEDPLHVVTGLQNEVRGYRHALGLEAETLEQEFGYKVLNMR